MTQPERTRTPIVLAGWLALMVLGAGVADAADLEAVATDSLLIQPAGPRPGEPGKAYANVQGEKAGSAPKFAGFAILDFPAPKMGDAEKVRGASLTLTQSVARFSRDGKIRLFIAPDASTKLDDVGKPLRFDPKAPGGLGDQIPGLIPLGLSDYAKGGTGDADPYPLTLDDAARKALDDRLRSGGTIRIVVAPEDAHVAATFFGAGARQADRRPKLTIATGP